VRAGEEQDFLVGNAAEERERGTTTGGLGSGVKKFEELKESNLLELDCVRDRRSLGGEGTSVSSELGVRDFGLGEL